MLEKQKAADHMGKSFGALLTDLSNTFDCLLRKLLWTKLQAYGFDINALRLRQNYKSNRQQRKKINVSFSK